MVEPTMNPPRVFLVGAGPGAADLITLRGLRLLQRADVVIADALIAPDLLAEARADAEVVHVGKRGWCVGSTKQTTIHELLVHHAETGRSVVRLKGGDPGIFGRGGEEAEVLAAHGIPFEIVPGVTTAVAAAASAGFALTHRAVGPTIGFVTGHHDPASPECTVDWQALTKLSTLVVYMGLHHLDAIGEKLIAAGLSPTTPCAAVAKATLPDEVVLTTTLEDLALEVRLANLPTPVVVIVGEAVAYREKFRLLAETALTAGSRA